MNIRFHNLGKIKETELDLRPMTVIIGPNNSNKTYIAYSIYGLWKTIRRRFRSSLKFEIQRVSHNSKTQDQVELGQVAFFVDVNSDFSDKVSERIKFVTQRFRSELGVFFQDSSQRLFAKTSFELEISPQEIFDSLKRMSAYSINIRNINTHYSYRVSYKENQILVVWMNAELDVIDPLSESSSTSSEEDAQSFALIAINHFLFNALFAETFLLPAERNAFIITYKILGARRYKLLRDGYRRFSSTQFEQQKIESSQEEEPVRYPQPVEDFLDFLTEVEEVSTRKRIQTKNAKAFAQLADMIETSIQNGNKTSYRSTVLGGKEIVISVEAGLEIDLYNASSSIKQLAPLLLYLRYRARENDLLIIDEPEMNLHPESQATLMEVLAILVNHGVKVLLTTHSPYILAHLNNLTQDNETSQTVKRRQAQSLYLKNSESLLRMDQVSAYEMRDNHLYSLKDVDYGIRWDTLSDVSVDLQQKYFEIYEEGHAKQKAKGTRQTAKTSGRQNGID